LNSHWQLANCERYSPYDCCVITFSVDIDDQGPQSSFCGPLEVLPGHFVDLYFPITQQEFEYCFSLTARAHLKMIIISQENYKKILPDKLCIETSENGYTKFYFDESKNSKTALIAYGCTAAEVSVNLESINVVFFNLFAPRRLKIEALAELLNCFDKVIIADVSGCDEFAFGLAGKLALARPQLQSKFKMMVQSTNYSGVGRRPRFMDMYAHTTQ
jgi:hypothetical protein